MLGATPPMRRLLVPRRDIVAMLKARKRAYSSSALGALLFVKIDTTKRYPLSYIEALLSNTRVRLDQDVVRNFNREHGYRLLEAAQLEWQERVGLYAANSTPMPPGFIGTREACMVLGVADAKIFTRHIGKGRLTHQTHNGALCLVPQEIMLLCEWPTKP